MLLTDLVVALDPRSFEELKRTTRDLERGKLVKTTMLVEPSGLSVVVSAPTDDRDVRLVASRLVPWSDLHLAKSAETLLIEVVRRAAEELEASGTLAALA